jgi:hypothetical protein
MAEGASDELAHQSIDWMGADGLAARTAEGGRELAALVTRFMAIVMVG